MDRNVKWLSECVSLVTKQLACMCLIKLSVPCLFVFCIQDIYLHSPNVRWDDIVGLNEAKRLIKEAVVYPIKVRWRTNMLGVPSFAVY